MNMRKFLITSPHFKGSAEILYREDGVLIKIDLAQTEMTQGMTEAFKKTVQSHLNYIELAFKNTKATVVEADFEVTFEMFWISYNKKINRKRCEPIWNKLSKPKQVKAYYGIKQYDKYLKIENWRQKADPETYLRNEMFDNEYN